jgi:hypothetical protein
VAGDVVGEVAGVELVGVVVAGDAVAGDAVVDVVAEVVAGVVVVAAPATPVSAAGAATTQEANPISAARFSVRRTLTREGTLPPGRRGREIGVH